MSLLTIPTQLLLSMPSGMEWIWVILVVVLLFGGKKIPELAKGLGRGIRDFNDAKKGVKDELEAGMRNQEEVKTTTVETPTGTTTTSTQTTTTNI